ncbi:cytochrome c3 family protein [Ideonella alba]|uniref:Cytochrome C n=1 Tax=Ideonella alba TaxID=2824118 RepID=A0A940Y4X8_9BURK|nr:cytochrome c3 family protein [Ideonella alba]MBQ0929857.1 cytochrome C [Ideonella alba]
MPRCLSRPYPWLWRLFAAVAALWLALLTPAAAQSLESALSPGVLTQSHAKWQDDCASCHVRFDRAAQDRLCADCHKPIGQDLRQKTGFHGRQKPQACRSCHTDHKGREARIVQLDTKAFDHRETDWVLRQAHAQVECAKCHLPGKRWAEAPQDCQACHRKDDVHKGSLGTKCADCHTEKNWKEARFDHATTSFALKGKHADVACADCHPKAKYAGVPTTCVGCHKADDKHKGRYGEKCESCHGEKSWKTISFNHDSETRYPLRGKHRAVRCDSCHTGALYREKTATDCLSCHRKDDKHQGSLGTECAACHQESDWKQTGRFDHDRARFPLLGKHADAKCEACHKPGPKGTPVYRDAPRSCIGCHRQDDKHAGNVGEACAACHGKRSWKIPRFDHDVARFTLRGAHAAAKVRCADCHQDLKHYRDTPRDCIGCHRKDDKHEGQLGTACESCHNDRRWKDAPYDHKLARFALLGAHVKVECGACHKTLRYRDAPRDCLGCHRADDRHKGAQGPACESCHNARHWKLAQFDHTRQTRYPLTGKHQPLTCEACHRAPAPAGRKTAPLGDSCQSCHRGDDVHDGGFGLRCETCHQTSGWRELLARRRTSPSPSPASGVPR